MSHQALLWLDPVANDA